ncbi:MAG: replicase [Brapardiv virus 2]|nr:MAG: replicase [Brapardiv virus 2]
MNMALDRLGLCICGGQQLHESHDEFDGDEADWWTAGGYISDRQREINRSSEYRSTFKKVLSDSCAENNEKFFKAYDTVESAVSCSGCVIDLKCNIVGIAPPPVRQRNRRFDYVFEVGTAFEFIVKQQKIAIKKCLDEAMPLFRIMCEARHNCVELSSESPATIYWIRKHFKNRTFMRRYGEMYAFAPRMSTMNCYKQAISGKWAAELLENKYPFGITLLELMQEYGKGLKFRPGYKFVVRGPRVHVVKADPRVRLERCAMIIWETHKYSIVAGDLDADDEWKQITDLCLGPLNSYVDDNVQDLVEEGKLLKEEVLVGAGGNCWMKIGGRVGESLRTLAAGQENKVSVSMMKMLCESFLDNPFEDELAIEELRRMWVYVTRQSDGDYHLEDVGYLMFAPGLMTLEEMLPPNCVLFTDWLTVAECDRLVGLPSTLDKAMAAFVVPDNKRGNEALFTADIGEAIVEAKENCPYAIPEINQDLALKYGIPFSQYSGKWHPHPIHAGLRIWECTQVIPKYVHTDCVFISMSPANFRMVERKKSDPNLQWSIMNPLCDIKDFGRYAGTMTIPDSVYELGPINCPTAVFHGSGHFMHPSTILDLSYKNPELRVLVITHVCPLDMYITDTSYRSGYEDWKIDREKGTVTICLEGDEGGKYEQPYFNPLLFAKHIISSCGRYEWFGGVVESRSSHFIQVWTKYKVMVPQTLPLLLDGYVQLPKVFKNCPPKAPMVPLNLFMSMYMYAKALADSKEKDLWGKLRTHTGDKRFTMPIGTQQWLIATIIEIAKWRLVPNLQSVAYTSFAGEIYYHTIGKVMSLKEKWWDMRYSARLQEILEPKQRLFSFPLMSYRIKSSQYRGCTYGLQVVKEDNSTWGSRIADCMKMWFHNSDLYIGKCKDVNGYLLLDDFVNESTYCLRWMFGNTLHQARVDDFLARMERRKHPDLVAEEARQAELAEEARQEELKARVEATKKAVEAKAKEKNEAFKVYEECETILKEIRNLICTTCDFENSTTGAEAKEAGSSNLKTIVAPDIKSHSTDVALGNSPLIILDENTKARGWSDEDVKLEGSKQKDVMQALFHESAKDKGRMPGERDEEAFEKLKGPSKPSESDMQVVLWKKAPIDLKARYVTTWEERRADWDKMYKKRPHSLNSFAGYTGSALWDAIYPKTVGQRHNLVPYRYVRFYPHFNYPVQDCLLDAVHVSTGLPHVTILFHALKAFPANEGEGLNGLSVNVLEPVGLHFLINFKVVDGNDMLLVRCGVKRGNEVVLRLADAHFTAVTRYEALLPTQLPTLLANKVSRQAKSLVTNLEKIPIINFMEWKPEPRRAELYIRALRANTTGLLGASPIGEEILRSWEENIYQRAALPVQRYLAVVEGSPGCRKSSALQKELRKPVWKNLDTFTVILPTVRLREDWAPKLDVATKSASGMGLKNQNLTTFEKTLSTVVPRTVVIQDEDKFPKGYKATLALIHPNVRFFIHLGDRYQSQRHEVNHDCLLNDPEHLGEGDYYSQYSVSYLLGSWRFGPGIANLFLLPSFNHDRGGIHFCDEPPSSAMELWRYFPSKSEEEIEQMYTHMGRYVPSHAAKMWSEEITGSSTDTYAGSQGESVEVALITLDNGAVSMTDYRIGFTVMTRAKSCIIYTKYDKHGPANTAAQYNGFWGPILQYKSRYKLGHPVVIQPTCVVDVMELVGDLPLSVNIRLAGPPDKLSNREFVEERWKSRLNFDEDFIDPDNTALRGGGRLTAEGVYSEAFTFKTYIDETPEQDDIKVPIRLPFVSEYQPRTHIPLADGDQLDEENDCELKDRFSLELSHLGEYSNQLPDVYMRRRDAADLLQKFFKVKQRQRVRAAKRALPPPTRSQKTKWVKELEKSLSNDFRLFIPQKLNWGLDQRSSDNVSFALGLIQRIRRSTKEDNWKEYLYEGEYGDALFGAFKTYMGWDSGVLWNELEYSQAVQKFQIRRGERTEALKKASLPRSEPDFTGMLTAKTQWKLKDEHQKPAKALQTIFVTGDEYLFSMGPLGIYLLDKILQVAPSYWYFHAKKTMDDFEKWASVYDDGTDWVINDLVGQDQGMSGAYVRMFVLLMEHFNVPDYLINIYLSSKLDFKTKQLVVGIMTLSGEIFTYLLNSLGSAARECLKFDLLPGQCMATGGDDTARKGSIQESVNWSRFEHMDRCSDKRYVSERGEFVSFIIKNGRVVKNPKILYRRLRGQIERGNLDNCYLGYFSHWAAAYKLKDELVTILTDKELEYHNVLTTFFMNGKKYTKEASKVKWELVNTNGREEDPFSIGSDDWQACNMQVLEDYLSDEERHGSSIDSVMNADEVTISSINSLEILGEYEG